MPAGGLACDVYLVEKGGVWCKDAAGAGASQCIACKGIL